MYHHFFPLLMVTLFWQPTKADEESFIEEMTNFTQMEPPKESQSTYLEQRKFLDLANMQDDELMSPGQTKKVKTSQSTVFIPSQFPDKPMDGSSQSGNCVQTLQEDDPWWMADLGSTQIVNSISITNRKDCCQEQINGVIILVGDSADLNGKMNARCAKVPSLGLGMTQVSKCGTMKGRYVTIINPGREKVLSFCDVQIFGKPWDSGHNNSIISIDDFYPLLPVSDDVPEIPRSVHSSATSYNFDLSENHIGE
uniref:Fucolectin tachylectin-4 pentraxin-1 domain-containing protein n=1 Tax=Monodelphis domestica TaxID=13616 RepID=A0A5F8HIQ6_MONDO